MGGCSLAAPRAATAFKTPRSMHDCERLCCRARTQFPTMLDGATKWAIVLGGLVLGACGAGIKALPEDIAPIPSHGPIALAVDGGGPPRADDGGPRALSVAKARSQRDPQETCSLRVRRISPTHVSVGRDVIDVVRRAGRGHFRAVTNGAGGIRGIAIYDLEPGSCLEVLGFQEDDVIVNVNGFDFTSPDAYREMYESIDSGTGADVRFERGPDIHDLRIDIARTP